MVQMDSCEVWTACFVLLVTCVVLLACAALKRRNSKVVEVVSPSCYAQVYKTPRLNCLQRNPRGAEQTVREEGGGKKGSKTLTIFYGSQTGTGKVLLSIIMQLTVGCTSMFV